MIAIIDTEGAFNNVKPSAITLQGGVLLPLLWNLTINGLLVNLEGSFKVVAYADVVAIGVFGKFPSTVSKRVQNALDILVNWTSKRGLNVNPYKTEPVLFVGKFQIPRIDPPVLNSVRLTFKDRTKYLGLSLDSKLSWKLNIEER